MAIRYELGPFVKRGARWRGYAALLLASSRAALELAFARVALADLKIARIEERNRGARRAGGRSAGERQRVDEVGFVTPRIAGRMPFRSDCLVQALAAQHWLLKEGIPSTIVLGVERPIDGDFGAHAWLLHGDRVVTGGEIQRYSPILQDDAAREQTRGD